MAGEYHIDSEKTECFAIFETDGEDTLTLTTYRWTEDRENYESGGTSTVIETMVVTVPEPATMSLLAIGGLALIRRRKRA